MNGAEVGGASADYGAADGSAAARAARPRLAREHAAAAVDGFAQHAPQVGEHRLDVVVAEAVDAAARMDAGAEQRLVRVQIADAGDGVLRHEHRLRSEEHTSELQSRLHTVCRLPLEK